MVVNPDCSRKPRVGSPTKRAPPSPGTPSAELVRRASSPLFVGLDSQAREACVQTGTRHIRRHDARPRRA